MSLVASEFFFFFFLIVQKEQVMTPLIFGIWNLSIRRNQHFVEKILHVNELQFKTVLLKLPDFLQKIVLSWT